MHVARFGHDVEQRNLWTLLQALVPAHCLIFQDHNYRQEPLISFELTLSPREDPLGVYRLLYFWLWFSRASHSICCEPITANDERTWYCSTHAQITGL